jgi:pimeloyl-ACP methyl ester carboxylesterase
MSTETPVDCYFQSGPLRLHYLEWGNEGARPLVLLHHVSTQAHTWDDFAKRMSASYRVLALDLRGHGDSQWAGEGNYTTEDYASDVAALAEHLRLREVIVLGGSLGGRVALVYAGQHPEQVAALIMEDVGPVRPAEVSQRFADRVAGGDPEFDTVEEWAEHLRGDNRRTPPDAFLHLARCCTRQLPGGKLGLKRDPMIQRDFIPLQLWQYVERVPGPFLLLIGAESVIVSPEHRDRMIQTIPGGRAVTFQGAGHYIVHDKPDEFENTVREFLTSHGL